jgi:metal-responsive CopG/Arc/MetJ family transcriptional regulator
MEKENERVQIYVSKQIANEIDNIGNKIGLTGRGNVVSYLLNIYKGAKP